MVFCGFSHFFVLLSDFVADFGTARAKTLGNRVFFLLAGAVGWDPIARSRHFLSIMESSINLN